MPERNLGREWKGGLRQELAMYDGRLFVCKFPVALPQHTQRLNGWCSFLTHGKEEAFANTPSPSLASLDSWEPLQDTHAVEGVRFTEGSLLHADRIADDNAPLVVQLESKGAIVVGKTNVPEFCAGADGQFFDYTIEQLSNLTWPKFEHRLQHILGISSEMPSSRAPLQGSQSFNSIFPTTVSPWDTRTTAGGSSGGSAAALASFQCWLASGTDMGGSVRTPAAFCGTVGFRVSPGRTPTATSGPLLGLHSISGPMARSVRDVALFLDALESSEGWAIEPHSPRCWDVNFITKSGVFVHVHVVPICDKVCGLLTPKGCFFQNLLLVMR